MTRTVNAPDPNAAEPTWKPARVAGVVPLADGRKLGFAEYGDPSGVPLIWLHGTPGSCRQVAPAASAAAERLGVRIIGVSRPGAGLSTVGSYQQIADIAPDVEQLADQLGLEAFAVVGLSGGGPYTLACGALLPGRVVGLGVLGGVAPSVGPDAVSGSPVDLARQLNPVLGRLQRPVATALNQVMRPLIPLGGPIGDRFFGFLPPGDRMVFEMPGVKDMLIGDLSLSLRSGHGLYAAVRDVVLFGRHWGFALDDVKVHVNWWHGDEDWMVPLEHGEHMVATLPSATFHLQPGFSHLSGYAAADDVIAAMRAYFD